MSPIIFTGRNEDEPSTSAETSDEDFIIAYCDRIAENLKLEISQHIGSIGRLEVVGSLKTRTFTYGDSDIDFFLISEQSHDHVKTSREVFEILKSEWNPNGTLATKELGRQLLKFPILEFKAMLTLMLTSRSSPLYHR